jgi:hypothetical protein
MAVVLAVTLVEEVLLELHPKIAIVAESMEDATISTIYYHPRRRAVERIGQCSLLHRSKSREHVQTKSA